MHGTNLLIVFIGHSFRHTEWIPSSSFFELNALFREKLSNLSHEIQTTIDLKPIEWKRKKQLQWWLQWWIVCLLSWNGQKFKQTSKFKSSLMYMRQKKTLEWLTICHTIIVIHRVPTIYFSFFRFMKCSCTKNNAKSSKVKSFWMQFSPYSIIIPTNHHPIRVSITCEQLYVFVRKMCDEFRYLYTIVNK